MDGAHVRIKFWGVRGSTPTPQIENLKFGGNTPCVELHTADNQRLIFDAGSGLRALGQSLMQESNGEPIDTKLFISHFHWDHIQGIPFFAPLYGPKNRLTFYSGWTVKPLQDTLEGQMAQPYFPVHFSQVAAQRDFHQVEENGVLKSGSVTIHPFPLNHPQGATGYRIETNGTVIVYATDYEHGDPALDKILLDYSQNADMLILDTTYTPTEYETHKGWGHSTWMNGVFVAREAKAEHLVLFHHDPSHDDQTMMRISQNARMQFDNTTGAWEGFVAAF